MSNAEEMKNEQDSARNADTAPSDVEQKLLRVCADFENFRRNAEKERLVVGHLAQVALLRDLLPFVDNFERALESFRAAGDIAPAEAARLQGVELLYRELQRLLEKYEVTEIPTDMPFNPEFHEAMMRVPNSGKSAESIVSVLQKGYLCRDTILRPARVSVAQ
ncbi:MAG: nucleotide exchange factor GrpE [Candidatus Babeliaceae bacterium]|nr:nucleotide exchange factor GrpE [Candidatus Babeliaceae bacterium]